MNGRVFLWVILCVLSLIPSVEASESEWKELNQKISILHAEGNHAEATGVAQKALDVAKKTYGDGHLNVAKSMNNLANLYLLEGKSRGGEAAELYQKAIAIEEKVLGKDHPDIADTLFNFAMLYVSLEKHNQATPLLERSLAIKEKKLGKEHPASLKVKKALEKSRKSPDESSFNNMKRLKELHFT